MLSLAGNHWHIENRLHYATDFTCDGDRCRARVRHLPRNLALPGQRRHFHHPADGRVQIPSRSQPPLRRENPGRPRRGAERLAPPTSPRPSTAKRNTADAPFLPEAGLRRPNPFGLLPLFGSRRRILRTNAPPEPLCFHRIEFSTGAANAPLEFAGLFASTFD